MTSPIARIPALLLLLAACGSEDSLRSARESDDAATRQEDAGSTATGSDASAVDAAQASRDAGMVGEQDAGDAPVRVPAECQASVSGAQPQGSDTFVANTGKKEVSSLTYGNVGAAGAYAEVVSGWSAATGCVGDTDGSLCKSTYRKPKQVSGPLAPFDEEMTLVFGGPVELYQVAVYSPRSSGQWGRDAYWDRCVSEGLVFAGNKSWHECAGFVESYVTADGTAKSDSPVQFSGKIAAGTEVHVMSSALCTGDECGYSSGLPLHGFKGDAAGSKIFATKFRMPIGSKTPAYWILPSQVVRSAQYGCNCRGQGSDPTYKGGCGELDVAEILGGVTTSLEATSTLYSFQGITGGGDVTFNRPVKEAATFLVIFDAQSRRIAIRRVTATAFDFASALSAEQVDTLLAGQATLRSL